MSTRFATWLAWTLYALALALSALSVLLLGLNWTTLIPPSWGFRGFPAILVVAFSTVGALIASRRPQHRIGWLFCAFGFQVGVHAFAAEYAIFAVLTHPGSLPGGQVAAWLADLLWIPYTSLIAMFLPLWFPTGILLSLRWRAAEWLAVAAIGVWTVSRALMPGQLENFLFVTNPFGIKGTGEILVLAQTIGSILYLTSTAVAVLSLIIRFRQSPLAERQQIKWLAYAATFLALALMLNIRPPNTTPPWVDWITSLLVIVAFVTIPIAVGIAILRYRLYDIDIIIRRTLQYSILTGMLALTYFASVVVLQQVVRAVTGEERSPLVTVLSTLAIAALFTPVRRRVQAAIDHRFYRRKYDAEQVLALFGVTVRNEVDLVKLTGALIQVAEETLHPAYLSLWLRPAKKEGKRSNHGG